MDILGIGFPELIVILIIAMMVFGPRRLPEIAGKAGKIVRDLRGMSQGLLLEWQREITVASRLDELQEVRRELELTKQELSGVKDDLGEQTTSEVEQIKKDIASIPATVDQAAKTASGDGQSPTATDKAAEPAADPAEKQSVNGQPEQPAVDGNRTPTEPEVSQPSLEERTIDPRPQVVRTKSSKKSESTPNSNTSSSGPPDAEAKPDAASKPHADGAAASRSTEQEAVETNGKSVAPTDNTETEPLSPKSSASLPSFGSEEVTNE